MIDQVMRAKANDDAVMRQIRRYHAEGQIHAIAEVSLANPDLRERIGNLIVELNEASFFCFIHPDYPSWQGVYGTVEVNA